MMMRQGCAAGVKFPSMHASTCACDRRLFSAKSVRGFNRKNVLSYNTEEDETRKKRRVFYFTDLRSNFVNLWLFMLELISIPYSWQLVSLPPLLSVQVLPPSVACAVSTGVAPSMRTQDWAWLSPSLTSLDTSMFCKNCIETYDLDKSHKYWAPYDVLNATVVKLLSQSWQKL